MSAPSIAYGALWPTLCVFATACISLVVEAFAPRPSRASAQPWIAGAGLATALLGVMTSSPAHSAEVTLDGPGRLWQALALLVAMAGVVLFRERLDVSPFAGQAAALPGSVEDLETPQSLVHTEPYALLLLATTGLMLLPVANDLVLLFVALEVVSLPLYVLVGLSRRRRLLSQEAAMKYFLLGAFASAFLMYGIALAYSATGSLQLRSLGAHRDALMTVALALLLIGMLFKLGAAPFQQWVPDVYQGAPTAVTAWMSVGVKVAASGALLRVLWVGLGAQQELWRPAVVIVALLSMAIGSALAIAQTDIKRILAYSAVAHTGFILVGVLGAATGPITATDAVSIYLLAYAPSSLGAFALISLVRSEGREATDLAAWAGIGRRHPWFGVAFGTLVVSMAGIPLTVGFLGKWAVLATAFEAHEHLVALVGVACSVVAMFVYGRLLLVMFFTPEQGAGAASSPSRATTLVLATTVVATFALGVLPGPMLNAVQHAGDLAGAVAQR